MVNAFFYSNIAVATTLSGNINNSVTSATVGATTGWPTSYPFIVAIDYGAANEELVQVTNNAAGTLTIVRGFGGTSAVAHSTGAVVRTVYNAQDATDFRTHEAAAASVHGVTGDLVGTTMTQTLTNKTLTTPTINAGALAGTFTGAPTFSGAVVFSGGPNISAGGNISGTVTGSPIWSGSPNFTGSPTFSGGATFNTVRPLFSRGAAGSSVLGTRVTGDTQDRLEIQADGKHLWGTGALAGDTNLYRSAADLLATDDSFSVGADLAVATTTWTTFTPTWTVGGSPPMDTNVGWYKKFGKIVFFEIYTVWGNLGSGSSTVVGNLPSTPFRAGNGAATTRQFISGFVTGTNTISPGMVMGQILAGGAGTAFNLHMYDNTGVQGGYIQNTTIVTLQGWYREA